MNYLSLFLIAMVVSACSDIHFEPYDYKKAEEARIKKNDYFIRLNGKQLKLEQKIKLQKQR